MVFHVSWKKSHVGGVLLISLWSPWHRQERFGNGVMLRPANWKLRKQVVHQFLTFRLQSCCFMKCEMPTRFSGYFWFMFQFQRHGRHGRCVFARLCVFGAMPGWSSTPQTSSFHWSNRTLLILEVDSIEFLQLSWIMQIFEGLVVQIIMQRLQLRGNNLRVGWSWCFALTVESCGIEVDVWLEIWRSGLCLGRNSGWILLKTSQTCEPNFRLWTFQEPWHGCGCQSWLGNFGGTWISPTKIQSRKWREMRNMQMEIGVVIPCNSLKFVICIDFFVKSYPIFVVMGLWSV